MKTSEVILVNVRDEPCGSMEKLEAHRTAVLHRAFSIFIFDDSGRMLLQQRAAHKYHSGGLWTNACCSHPQPGDDTLQAASRRLQEEMGFSTGLKKIFHFIYKTGFENGLYEHEFDHVFAGEYNGPVQYNKDEVNDVCYKSLSEISAWLLRQPEQFTHWFRLAFPGVRDWWQQATKRNQEF